MAACSRGIQNASANPIPTRVPGVTGVTAIAVGGQHMLALTGSGRVLSWGYDNVYRPVGHPGAAPGFVPLITAARAVLAGSLSSIALLSNNTFMVWGALPPLSFRVDGVDMTGSTFPIPMVVKGL